MITVHPELDCEAAREARALSHDYLMNRIRSKSDPVLLRKTLLSKDGSGFAMWSGLVTRLEMLCDRLEDDQRGYSPAQLVKRIPAFHRLSDEQQQHARTTMHQRFVKESGFVDQRERLGKAIFGFRASVETFLAQSGDLRSADAHREVDTAAAVLLSELNKLSRGVWLWPNMS